MLLKRKSTFTNGSAFFGNDVNYRRIASNIRVKYGKGLNSVEKGATFPLMPMGI